jgi:cobalt-zinc-cadmium efflux system membrane fusion protein
MKTINYIFPILSLALLMSCGGEEVAETLVSVDTDSANSVVVTSAQFELGKMKLGTFTKQTFQEVVNANGMLDVPPENKSTVSAYFGGYVKNISLLQGQKISKGQTLFTLESPDYIQVQQDFLAAKSQLDYLKSDYERQKELAASNVSSEKIYLKAASDYKTTLATYEALKKKLELMNIDPNRVTEVNLSSTISVKAPISGYVTDVLATKGMFLNPSDIAVTIMNTDHMHIELNIFEQDLTKVNIGQEVTFGIQNGEDAYPAVVHLINKAIDPEKRTVKVHCHFKHEADAQALTPGMFVAAKIYTSHDSTLALPKNAVISVENKFYVLRKIESETEALTFERVEVEVGQTNEAYTQILNGGDFNTNAKILVEGSFNLIQE